DVDAAQRRVANAQVGYRLAAHFPPVVEADVRAHQAQDIENAGAGRVDAHMGEDEVRSGGDRGGYHEESGGGNIRRHFDVAGGELAAAAQAYPRSVTSHRVAEAAHHACGMVRGPGG